MVGQEIGLINDKVKKESAVLDAVRLQMSKVLIGQSLMIDRLLIGILGNGHILLEGVPGLAKTTAVRTLAQTIQAKFQRIQFTPDMLPADLIGTLIYDPRTANFNIKKGPIFANIILADEINRAPAKVQSALLEAMQERQVTIGEQTLKLDSPFLVLATQNPIEQEGTYPLPEAQVDRFMLKVKVDYPSKEEELKILRRMGNTHHAQEVQPVLNPQDILRLREVVDQVYMDEKIENYIVELVSATRHPENYSKLKDLKSLIQYPVSPRATIFLAIASRAHAFIAGRGFVTPQDIKTVGMDVLCHRLMISYEAEAEGQTSQDIIKRIFNEVEVP